MIAKTRKEIWIGLVELSGPTDNYILEGCHGAYSNFLVAADTIEMFKRKAVKEASSLGLNVVKVEWAMPLNKRLQKQEVEAYLIELAKNLPSGGRFGKFHVWEEEE